MTDGLTNDGEIILVKNYPSKQANRFFEWIALACWLYVSP